MVEPKTAKEYLQQPYARMLVPEGSGGFSGRILEFPGCVAEGKTRHEAFDALELAAEGWLEVALALGHTIPRPLAAQAYSGKIALRLPPALHEQLVAVAEVNHATVNQFIVAAISEKVAQHRAVAEILPPIREIVSESIREVTESQLVTQILPPIREAVGESIRHVAAPQLVEQILPPLREVVGESIRQVAETELVARILPPLREVVGESIRQVSETELAAKILPPLREVVEESVRQVAGGQLAERILVPLREVIGASVREVVETHLASIASPREQART